MGNNFVHLEYASDDDEYDDDDDYDEEGFENDGQLQIQARLPDNLTTAIGSMMGQIVGSLQRPTTEMPVIRKKPDLSTFRHTMMYKEIKAMCGLPPNSKRPNERWSMTRALMRRENGIGLRNFNHHRRIANMFIPNKKDKRLMSLESKVFVCKINKDGSKLITACQDSIIRIYDASKGTYHRINRIKARDVNWSILDIDFSPCGQYFAYSTWSDYFFTVPINGTTEQFQYIDLNTEQNRTGIFSVRFSPCGRNIIGGCNNSCIYIADRETHAVKSVRAERYFQVDINAVSYVSDYNPHVFVSGCNNGLLNMWDTRCLGGGRGGRNVATGTFLGHLDGITYIDSRQDGNYILTNSKDQTIRIWDVRKTTPSSKINKHSHVPLLEWDYRWDTVPREYYNPTQPLDGDVSVMTYRGHRVAKSLLRAKFSPLEQTGQRYIYTGCATGRIIIYDVLTGTIKEAIEGHKDIVRDLAWHPQRSEIISSSWDSHVNMNSFKPDPLLKRSNSERSHRPLRRSRRLAHKNGEVDEDEEDDEGV